MAARAPFVMAKQQRSSALGRDPVDCLAQGSCWVRLRECLHDWSPGGSVAIGALGTYAATARLRHSGGLVIQLVSVHRPSRVPPDKRSADFGVRAASASPWRADAFLA